MTADNVLIESLHLVLVSLRQLRTELFNQTIQQC